MSLYYHFQIKEFTLIMNAGTDWSTRVLVMKFRSRFNLKTAFTYNILLSSLFFSILTILLSETKRIFYFLIIIIEYANIVFMNFMKVKHR